MGSSNKPMRASQQSTSTMMKSNLQKLLAKIEEDRGFWENFRCLPYASTLLKKDAADGRGKQIRVGAYQIGTVSPGVFTNLSAKGPAEYCSPATDISFFFVMDGVTHAITDKQLDDARKIYPFRLAANPKALKFMIAFYYMELGQTPGMIYDPQSLSEFAETCKSVAIDAQALELKPVRRAYKGSANPSELEGSQNTPKSRQEKRSLSELFKTPTLNTAKPITKGDSEDTSSPQDSPSKKSGTKSKTNKERKRRPTQVVDLSDDSSDDLDVDVPQALTYPPKQGVSNPPANGAKKRSASNDELDNAARKKAKMDEFIEHCLKGASVLLAQENIETETLHTQVKVLLDDNSQLQSKLHAQTEDQKKIIEEQKVKISKLEAEAKAHDEELEQLRTFKNHVMGFKFPG
ncbi:hypothetical protein DM02DRAFT_165705 [Periconia macrospinosa]|uniref:Uncharacterized protein n=1 Tax=Periconia macrospinosa TaxID=97972 RepID=A0A2V1DDF0_9PLEO|nr:hypothetical protein DM02DRAFT_165705 [Periconia macrospinosa]